MKIIIHKGRDKGDVHEVAHVSKFFYRTVDGLIFSKYISKPVERAKGK